jgi:hypothetical protein
VPHVCMLHSALCATHPVCQHYTFNDFIINKARGESGLLLFNLMFTTMFGCSPMQPGRRMNRALAKSWTQLVSAQQTYFYGFATGGQSSPLTLVSTRLFPTQFVAQPACLHLTAPQSCSCVVLPKLSLRRHCIVPYFSLRLTMSFTLASLFISPPILLLVKLKTLSLLFNLVC